MVLFCPACANLLFVDDHKGRNAFACPTCPYQYSIPQRCVNRIIKGAPVVEEETSYTFDPQKYYSQIDDWLSRRQD